jgi:hypothetical protein
MAEAMKACFDIEISSEHEDRIIYQRTPLHKEGTYLTKSPHDVPYVKPFLYVNSKLYVVYLLRDPRDVITSTHRRDPNKYFIGLGYWKKYTKATEKLRDHPRFITVRYEDFVRDPDGVQERLIERMPFLSKEASFSRYHEVAKPSGSSTLALSGVRPIAPTSVGRWKSHLPRIAGQIHQHGSISDKLIEYGYEEDDSWEDMLSGVKPDLNPSHKPPEIPGNELLQLRRRQRKELVRILMHRLGIRPKAVKQWVQEFI